MRWDNLTVEADQEARLPGYRDPAVVRTFDAPEALNTRFYEVRAKSALNRVPEQSRMPFRWTINPYRGCTHACVFCLGGETPVLMADGRHKPIADLELGDEIYGTQVRGRRRRYVRTTVVDKWVTIKPAYRVTLHDGTELVASGDHRFLADCGWRHVADVRGPGLTTSHRLMGTGAFASQPRQTGAYRHGYLRGVVRAGAWPNNPAIDWCRGFLAGIFDAEGSRTAQAMTISTDDPEAVGWTVVSLRRLGFAVEPDRERDDRGVMHVRVAGGLPEHLRFFHATDPEMADKRSIEGHAVGTADGLMVAEIEPLGRALPLYDITTGTGDFIANGIVSHNCFARPTHKYLDFDAGRDFEREIVVKVNAPEVLRTELARPSWKHEHVAIGTNTDPYQWVEGRYQLMPEIWAALRDARNPCSVLTKSPLLLRDIDLFKELVARTSFTAALSVPTLEEKAWRSSEPRTPHPRARLEAVAELNRHGIPTGILIAPLMPGVNDDPRQVAKIIEIAEEAGAVSIGGIALHLRGEVRQVFMEWLRHARPDLVPHYEALYRRGAYAPPAERERLAKLVRRGRGGPSRWRDAGGPVAAEVARRRPEAEQTALF